MSADDYHNDPCPMPSLSQSLAKILLDRSPLHAWHNHPRLNPAFERDEATKFDVGNVAHKLLLGRGKGIIILPFGDWRTGAAKAGREQAIAGGKIAVLEPQYERAHDMVDAAREQLKERGLGHLFDAMGCQAELVTCWREGETWFKQMLDWRSSDGLTIADYKTTELSIAPQNLGRMMVNAGWHIQAAMAHRGLGVLDPDTAARRQYLFIVQEAQEPHPIQVVEIAEGPMTVGRKSIEMAVHIWRHCMSTNTWPGYPQEIIRPEMPGWFEQAVLDREIAAAGKARVSRDFEDLTMAG
jgi:hypothetical protein